MFKQVNQFFIAFCLLFIGTVFFICFNISHLAAAPSATKDAIAVRIIPNPEHQSALDWYRAHKYKGSPQNITVDGYNAIRDGRTVYVNAANVDGVDEIKKMYTNIYIISYNQDAENETVDIFSRLLDNWKFNTNRQDSGYCENDINKSCFLDSDCGAQELCISDKAAIIRDVLRMEGLYTLKLALANYYNKNGHYPQLKAGTYLPHKSISTWPSWQKVLAQELELKLPVDPVNRLGDCGDERFNKTTCWDEKAKEFADPENNGKFDLPYGSNVYVYEVSPNGLSYNLCAPTEAGYVDLNGNACADSPILVNNAPKITSYSFPEKRPGEDYQGYIKASDPDGDMLTWIPSPPNWLKFENDPYDVNKRIFSGIAPGIGEYVVNVTIKDGKGGEVTQSFIIKIYNYCDMPGGGTLAVGDSRDFYKETYTHCDNQCDKLTRTCMGDGTLSGDSAYKYKDCVHTLCDNCIWNGQVLLHNTTAPAYAYSKQPDDKTCEVPCTPGSVFCFDGDLQGEETYPHTSCAPRPCEPCTYQGFTINSGNSKDFYNKQSAPCEQKCVTKSVSCYDSQLEGITSGYVYPECTEIDCATCYLPAEAGGGSITEPDSITLFSRQSVSCTESCDTYDQLRVCLPSGQLDGSSDFKYKCTQQPCQPCPDPFSGHTLPDGTILNTYSETQPPTCGTPCDTFVNQDVCKDGTWDDGIFLPYQSCDEWDCPVNNDCTHTFSDVGVKTIADGTYMNAHPSPTVPCGSSCVSAPIYCNNGTKSGAGLFYSYYNCASVLCPNDCDISAYGGTTLAVGAKKDVYKKSVVCDESCEKGEITCTINGLTGNTDYKFLGCGKFCASCSTILFGIYTNKFLTLQNDASYQVYKETSLYADQLCEKGILYCHNGIFYSSANWTIPTNDDKGWRAFECTNQQPCQYYLTGYSSIYSDCLYYPRPDYVVECKNPDDPADLNVGHCCMSYQFYDSSKPPYCKDNKKYVTCGHYDTFGRWYSTEERNTSAPICCGKYDYPDGTTVTLCNGDFVELFGGL